MADLLFEDAYLARIYDLWHPRSVRDDYDYYLPIIMAADSVLDMGCGTGTLLHDARDRGHTGRLVGIDPAEGMLTLAQSREDIEWVLGDLQSAGWSQQFDLIVMTGHAFQAIVEDADLESFVAAVGEALVPGGRFAFETRNPLARAWERWSAEYAATIDGPDGLPVRITTDVVEPFDGRTVAFTHAFTGEHPALPMVSLSTLRFLEAEGVRRLLESAGLWIESQIGDFDGSPLTEASREIITLAVR